MSLEKYLGHNSQCSLIIIIIIWMSKELLVTGYCTNLALKLMNKSLEKSDITCPIYEMIQFLALRLLNLALHQELESPSKAKGKIMPLPGRNSWPRMGR